MKQIESQKIFNGFKNCIFYLQENFLILIFLMMKKVKAKEIERKNLSQNNYFELCSQLVEENSIWLNSKSNYEEIYSSNNVIVNNTLTTILE